MAEKWIGKALASPSSHGALHREMGVPEGQTIPEGKLDAAADKGGTLGKRANLALTLKGLHHAISKG